MKSFFTFFIVMIFCVHAGAQAQETQQLKLDLEKLAQFKLILSQMKQGYQVLQNGYNAVRDVAKGNFDLHKNYLDGLLTVSLSVRQSPALRQIASEQETMTQMFQTAMQQYLASGLFTSSELASLRNQYNASNQKVNDGLDVLAQVIIPGKLRMDDAERLQLIDAVHADISVQYAAVKTMITDHSRVLALRLQQGKDNDAFKRLSGLK